MNVAGRFDEIFISRAYGWLYDMITPNTTLIDIGANIGDTAIFFALNKSVKSVIAFEPFPAVYAKLVENTRAYPKVKCRNAAVAAAASSKHLRDIPDSLGTDYLTAQEARGGVLVNAVTLTSVLRELKNVAIKSDCEGAEATMFDNADLSQVYAIQLEYHHNRTTVINSLKKKGFTLVDEQKPLPDMFGKSAEGYGILGFVKKQTPQAHKH